MADHTNIEWTDATWNPIVGCSIVSPGCTKCYAMQMARRIEAMQPGTHYVGTTKVVNANAVWTGKVALAPEHILTQPLRWRRGRRIFVNSMGDLFHESVPDEWIDRVFAVMALAPQHTFQVLTKRSARMRKYMAVPGVRDRWVEASWPLGEGRPLTPQQYADRSHCGPAGNRTSVFSLPALPNVWLGVSAEDQRRADERVPDLLVTPVAVCFVSAEPLLGPIDFKKYLLLSDDGKPLFYNPPREHIDWIIVGGESGPGARPMHPDWARSIRDQCAVAGVPFHFKQWGAWKDGSDFAADAKAVLNDGTICDPTPEALYALDRVSSVPHRHPTMMRRVGKHSAGRLLDGQEHNGMPSRGGAS